MFPPNGPGTNQDYLLVATDENNNPGVGMAVLSGGAGPDSTGFVGEWAGFSGSITNELRLQNDPDAGNGTWRNTEE